MRSKTPAQASVVACMAVATLSFLVLMTVICMVLRPQLFSHPHWGLSYFGAQPITFLPYYLGFAVVIACLAQITRLLWRVQGLWRPLRSIFLVSTILSALIAATSYMRGAFLYWSHIYICLALMLWVLGAEVWILSRPGTTWLDYGALTLLVAGVVLVNLSGGWIGVLGIFYWAEVVLFLGAFACLGRAAWRAVAR